MKAKYEKINGIPMLQLEYYEGYGFNKRHVVDIPLLPEQARSIEIQLGVRAE